MRKLLNLLVCFLSMGVISGAGASAIEVDGALVNAAALIPLLNTIAQNGAPGPGDFQFNALAVDTSLSAVQTINGIVLYNRTTTGGTMTLPTAANVIAQLPGGTNSAGAMVGRNFLMAIFNTCTPGVVTLATNTGFTLAGTMVVAANSARWFFGTVATSTGITLTSIAQNTIAA